MTKNMKAQFKSGWLRACERYTCGETVEEIHASGTLECAYTDGLRAACEAINGCPTIARDECARYGFMGEEHTALLAVTLDV